MKPVRLELEAFGSFAGHEVIDFEALAPRGLFVVSGDTGTGKTTIFDAMCWALYGDMPLKDTKGVRSHHVPDQTRTLVTFTFDCGGERYVVTRNPKQLRPARGRSGYATEEADAQLVRITSTGGTESRVTGSKDTAAACAELIGLDAKQFQRVILLPQGKFAEFLLADSNTREALLSQLFGAKVFDGILERLKSDLDDLRRELGDTDARISERLHGVRGELVKVAGFLEVELVDPQDLGRDDLAAALDTMRPLVDRLRVHVGQLQESSSAAAATRATAESAARRFDRAAALRHHQGELQAQGERIEALAAAAELAVAARPVIHAAAAAHQAQLAATAAESERAAVLDRIAQAFTVLGVEFDVVSPSVTSIQGTIQQQRVANESRQDALVGLTEAQRAHDSLQEAQRELIRETQAVTERRSDREQVVARIDQQLPALREQAATLAELREGIDQLRGHSQARADLDEVLAQQIADVSRSDSASAEHGRLLREFVATQAPRLAETLEQGEPCPVCGSVDHPSPADPGAGSTVTFDDVERAAAEREAAQRQVQQDQERISALRARLGDLADVTADELAQRHAELSARVDVAAVAADELARLETHRGELSEKIAAADNELAALTERAGRAAEDLAQAATALSAAAAAARDIDPEQVGRAAAALEQLASLSERIEDVFGVAALAAAEASTLARQLDDELERSPFDSVDEAGEAHLDPEQEQAHRRAVQQHANDLAETTGALQALADQGVPDERPDVATAAAAADAAAAAHQEAMRRLGGADVEAVGQALGRHDQLVASSGDLRDRAELVERVHRVCSNGGPGAEMSLKRWVLTRELDRVTAAANVHLHRMTSQRYMLRRVQERTDGRRTFGLDLEVLDAQTGRERSTSSLSGGEQFQASLSLALGLADVVSQGGNASGKQFEALFVDEGFGSLSAQALDDAIETLYQLQATGRMVGAITHVDAMKQQLHVGIEVRRRGDARGSTLVVHP